MRAYIAIRLSQEARVPLLRAQQNIEKLAPKVFSWSELSNSHLTLYFLGDLAEDSTFELEQSLRSLQLKILRLGWGGLVVLPEPTVPKILSSGVIGDVDALRMMQRKIHDAVFSIASNKETRAYFPHVTFGRLKKGIPPSAKIVKRALAEFTLEKGEIEVVEEIGVFASSETGESGTHKQILTIKLETI